MTSPEEPRPHRAAIAAQLRAGQRVAAAATVLTLLLAAGKGAIGHLRGSPALTADAVHSLADTVAIAASWLGLKLAGRPPTARFPFGLYRVETLATLVVAIAILAAGGHLLIESLAGLWGGHQPLHHSLEVLAAALLSAVLSSGIYLAERRAGTRLGSGSLLANADESRIDILSSLAVFAGAAASYAGVRHVEMAVTAGLATMILWLGFVHGSGALLSLLDASRDRALEEQIGAIAARVPGVRAVAELRLRQAGLFWFGTIRVQISRWLDIARGHQIAHAVADAVRQAVPKIELLTVHLEPFAAPARRVLVPVEGAAGDTEVSDHFGRAPFFAVATLEEQGPADVRFLENPARTLPARAGLQATKDVLAEHRVEAALVRQIGEIAYHTLRDLYVEIYQAPAGSLEQALQRFVAGQLELLPAPTHPSHAQGAPANGHPPDAGP